MAIRTRVQIYNDVIPFPKKTYSGTQTKELLILEGSRLVFTAHIFSLDPGATVNVNVSTSPSLDMPFCPVLTLSGLAAGPVKGVLSDFHGFIDVELDVVGGNAEVIIGMSVYDNALTTRIENAEIQVDLNHITQPNGTHDSMRWGDGVEIVEVNPDGSINVNIVNSSVIPELVKNITNKITGVADSIRTSIVSHTAVAAKQTYLQFISANGNNTAGYEVEVNGVFLDQRDTYFGGPLAEQFSFHAYSENGLIIPVGQKIEVFVTHCRPFVGDFNARIQILEIG